MDLLYDVHTNKAMQSTTHIEEKTHLVRMTHLGIEDLAQTHHCVEVAPQEAMNGLCGEDLWTGPKFDQLYCTGARSTTRVIGC